MSFANCSSSGSCCLSNEQQKTSIPSCFKIECDHVYHVHCAGEMECILHTHTHIHTHAELMTVTWEINCNLTVIPRAWPVIRVQNHNTPPQLCNWCFLNAAVPHVWVLLCRRRTFRPEFAYAVASLWVYARGFYAVLVLQLLELQLFFWPTEMFSFWPIAREVLLRPFC